MDKSNQLDFSGQDIYVGLDTHLKSWRVSIIVGETVYKTFSQDPNSKLLNKYLVKNFPNANYFSAYEASFSGFKTHRDLVNLGIKNIVVNPVDISVILIIHSLIVKLKLSSLKLKLTG